MKVLGEAHGATGGSAVFAEINERREGDPGAQQSEPRPQNGGDCGSHRDNLTTALPPHLSECWETNRMASGANR